LPGIALFAHLIVKVLVHGFEPCRKILLFMIPSISGAEFYAEDLAPGREPGLNG
jgi:hypothetical protein